MSIDIAEEVLDLATGNVQEAQPTEGVEMTEWVFANEKNDGLRQLFHSFYQGVFQNRIGLAQCRNKTTGEIETVIMGVHPTAENGVQLYPLAVVLTEDNGLIYESPNGQGGYVGADA